MRVSRNELIAVLRQAFEGLGFFQGDFENAADMVVWSEMHGLQGLAELEQLLTAIDQRSKVAITSNPATTSEWDVAGASSFECADLAIGMLKAKQSEKERVMLRLVDCQYPTFIGKSLVDCRTNDFFIAALWRQSTNPDLLHLYSQKPGHMLPVYLELNMVSSLTYAAVELMPGELFLIGASKVVDLLPELTQESVVRQIQPQEMRASYDQALQQGIEIETSLWRLLLRLGERVLVEATEQSRLGAGA